MLLSRKHSQEISTVMLTFVQIPCVIMNYRNVIRLVCISLLLKDNNLLTLDTPEGFLVSSIIVVLNQK